MYFQYLAESRREPSFLIVKTIWAARLDVARSVMLIETILRVIKFLTSLIFAHNLNISVLVELICCLVIPMLCDADELSVTFAFGSRQAGMLVNILSLP